MPPGNAGAGPANCRGQGQSAGLGQMGLDTGPSKPWAGYRPACGCFLCSQDDARLLTERSNVR